MVSHRPVAIFLCHVPRGFSLTILVPAQRSEWRPFFGDPVLTCWHVLEILQSSPLGKGLAKWHRPTHAMFLGIGHTAVVVRDTEASLRFFRDTLGLSVIGHSENYGTEQEHLNQVFGARLRITALRATGGPGIEFLEYLASTDGLPMPASERPNDLYHWHIRLVTSRLSSLAQQLHDMRTPFLSGNSVAVSSHALGFSKGLLVREPTGHVLQLVER